MPFETERFIDIIRRGRGIHDAATFAAAKAEANLWRPYGYDAHQVNLRHYYEGQIEAQLRAFAATRFPNTAKRMPLVPINWARHFAENGAAVFDYPPTWTLKRGDTKLDAKAPKDETEVTTPDRVRANVAASKAVREIVDGDRKRAADFATMVQEAGLEVVMAEAERRVVLARTLFLRVHSDSIEATATGKPARTKVTPFWPGDVLVIPHPRCPTSLSTAVALMARVSGESGVQGNGTTWEVWTRGFEEDENGDPTKFLPWRCELITETTTYTGSQTETDAKVKTLMFKDLDGKVSDEWPLPTLPWVEWHNGVPSGCPVLDVDRNLIPIFNAVNSSLMSETFAVDMNAAAVLIRKSDQPNPKNVVLGPGAMGNIRRDEEVVTVPMGADFAGMRASNSALVGITAKTNRQSASDYDAVSDGSPSSGVALRIKNEPQAKARLEAVARAIEMTSRLLAVMVMVHDHWRATSIADDGVTYCLQPQDPPEYEEKAATQSRALEALAQGLISEAACAVLCGYYRTEDEARAAIEKIRMESVARVPSGLRSALDKIAGEPKPDEPGDEPKTPDKEPAA